MHRLVEAEDTKRQTNWEEGGTWRRLEGFWQRCTSKATGS